MKLNFLQELVAKNIRVPNEMQSSLMIIHSYLIVKVRMFASLLLSFWRLGLGQFSLFNSFLPIPNVAYLQDWYASDSLPIVVFVAPGNLPIT